jgi:hypothetical protein
MTNYKTTDLNFFKNMFGEYERNKKNLLFDKNIPTNKNHIIDLWAKNYNFELRNKIAFVKLNTDAFDKKTNFIDEKIFLEKKYCTMYKKSNFLGPNKENDFTKKFKKIGDISFEEEDEEPEMIKNLKRLSPDNITEEWLKDNLNNSVETLKLDNCYWLSKDLVSKLGRIDNNLKVKN